MVKPPPASLMAQDPRLEALLQPIVTSMIAEAAYAVRAADGVIVYVHPRFADMFGYAPEEMLGRHVALVNAPTAAAPEVVAQRILAEILATGCWQGEVENIRKGGERFWSSARVTTVEDPEHGLLAISLHTDISEQKRAQDEERRLNERLQQAKKLDSLALLAGGVAHDFNNLLTAILGNIDLMMHASPSAPPDPTRLQAVRDAAVRAANLAEQLRACAGGLILQLEPLDLGELITSTVQVFGASPLAHPAVTCQVDPQLPQVQGDHTQLGQVVMNLLLNAAEAMVAGPGIIAVSANRVLASDCQLARGVVSEAPPAGAYVRLSVVDQGAGMSTEELARIFDPFFSTKSQGSGMGLAVVLGIIRVHGGTIEVASTPGKGTRFDVYLPCAQSGKWASTRPASGAYEAADLPPWPADRIVLVVDDEPAVLEVAGHLLEDAGIASIAADGGARALEIFAARGDEIGAALVDRTMPGISGAALREALRALRPDLPVVMSSGFHAADDAGSSARGPNDGFLKKPYTLRQLLKALRAVLPRTPD